MEKGERKTKNEPNMKKATYNKKEDGAQNLGENLKKLAAIAEWLEAQERSEEPDFDAGLAKVREAAELIKVSRARLATVENEFHEITKNMDAHDGEGETETG
jgi:exonuclease VII small subunit